MLWRVRATLPDRPGALAGLAAECGASEVNILGFQIFPGVDLVTDELVLDTPQSWHLADIEALVRRSGGQAVSVVPCTEAALADQPTRYVHAAASVLASPASFPDVLARLFDAEAESSSGEDGSLDLLEVTVASVLVQVRRTAPFTATEHARADALASLVDDVLARAAATAASVPLAASEGPEYVVEASEISAVVGGAAVGTAAVRPALDEPEASVLNLSVDPAWRRRGIGSRLLSEAVRVAASQGAAELVLTTRADNQAVLPMVLAAGLRGRIRMSGDRLTVRIPLAALHR
ncbi:GNAT family N-acetyltransferase [Nocardioides agariphilus]|jgi:ribosomal protein S18 acetylase RimI-like enzyme|uniref:GNAT family N-acetyltransferase n=1 Tax=Nocardioides agariphilus TaxID=433664 RepID=A0A930YJ94_9ACTN|nr:GNAT family N-acetyltransferase [Nocardioides agariphilus]MBF4769032.1 GNAT family N-acetyltransferase [Nocardioides agariphilus]